jgi:hypothetical protein
VKLHEQRALQTHRHANVRARRVADQLADDCRASTDGGHVARRQRCRIRPYLDQGGTAARHSGGASAPRSALVARSRGRAAQPRGASHQAGSSAIQADTCVGLQPRSRLSSSRPARQWRPSRAVALDPDRGVLGSPARTDLELVSLSQSSHRLEGWHWMEVAYLDIWRTLTCEYGFQHNGWTGRTDLRIRRSCVRA